MSTDTQAAAYHEAGHGLAAYIAQAPMLRLSIVEGPDRYGTSIGRTWRDLESLPKPIDRRTRRRLQAEIITGYAGVCTERLCCDGRDSEAMILGAVSDFARVRQLASVLLGYPLVAALPAFSRVLDQGLASILLQSQRLVRDPGFRVAAEAVAATLLLKQELSFLELRAAIHQSWGDMPMQELHRLRVLLWC